MTFIDRRSTFALMDVRALIRGSDSGTPPQKRPDASTRRTKLPARPASLSEPKRQHLMRVERVLQIHRDWVLRHGRPSTSIAPKAAADVSAPSASRPSARGSGVR